MAAAPAIETSSPAPRLVAIDFFRGLSLIFVLLNHLDWAAGPTLIRRVTPVGLGYSDAAEAFVFLSGLTFGWVYSARILRDGLKRNITKVLSRSLQIYAGYVVTLLLIAAFSVAPVSMADWTRNALRIGDDESFSGAVLRGLMMETSPFGIGILALYVVLLPGMVLLLAAARRSRLVVLAVSLATYIAVQPPVNWTIVNPSWFSGWSFHPFAWQFLFLVGMLIGERLQRTQTPLPRNRTRAALSVAVVLCGFLYGLRRDAAMLTGTSDHVVWQWIDPSESWLIAKPRLGPFRVVHLLALACLAASLLPVASRFWQARWIKPVVATGRHSLTIYCFGTLLVYASSVPFYWFGSDPAVVIIVAVDACLLQFALAGWLERRRQTRTSDARLPEGALNPAPDAAGTS